MSQAQGTQEPRQLLGLQSRNRVSPSQPDEMNDN